MARRRRLPTAVAHLVLKRASRRIHGLDRWVFFAREWHQPHLREAFATTRRPVLAIWKSYEQIPSGHVQSTISSSVTFYSGVAPERCLKISTAVLSASRCLSNADISISIRAIAAIKSAVDDGGSTGG